MIPVYETVKEIMTERLRGPGRVRVLEAGCGAYSEFPYPPNAYLVGIDISERQLGRNNTLHEKHVGDIQNYSLSPESFDMIVCWDVLEHLPQPGKALDNFAKWLAPGGIMVLAMPNLLSAEGLATRFTPFWFHVFWYRQVVHSKIAGRDEHGPFRTYLRRDISLPRLMAFSRRHGLTVHYAGTY